MLDCMTVYKVPIDEMSVCRIIVKMSIDKMNRQNFCWRKYCIQDDFKQNDQIKWLVVMTVDKITFGKIMSIGNRLMTVDQISCWYLNKCFETFY